MLEKLEILLGFHEEDITPELEEKLELILESVQARLKNLLGGMEIPGSMEDKGGSVVALLDPPGDDPGDALVAVREIDDQHLIILKGSALDHLHGFFHSLFRHLLPAVVERL